MEKYKHNAINLIAKTFEECGVKFDVVSHDLIEELLAGFPVEGGPGLIVRFVSMDDDKDVAVRIYGMVTKTPVEKHIRVMQACNLLNHRVRYLKFYVDNDGDINVEYDFPLNSSDDKFGEMAFEMFIRTAHILNSEYKLFMKALYSDEELETEKGGASFEIMQKLMELRKMLEARASREDVDLFDEDNDDQFTEDDD